MLEGIQHTEDQSVTGEFSARGFSLKAGLHQYCEGQLKLCFKKMQSINALHNQRTEFRVMVAAGTWESKFQKRERQRGVAPNSVAERPKRLADFGAMYTFTVRLQTAQLSLQELKRELSCNLLQGWGGGRRLCI